MKASTVARSIHFLKPDFQRRLRPVMRFFLTHRVSSITITAWTCLLSVGYGASLFHYRLSDWLLIGFPFMLLLRMGLNALDGMVAVETNQLSRHSILLNEMGDVIADIALYAPFFLSRQIQPALLGGILAFSLLSELTGVAVQAAGGARDYSGPFGKSDRALFFGVVACALGLLPKPGLFLHGLLAIGVILSALTVINRMLSGWKSLEK